MPAPGSTCDACRALHERAQLFGRGAGRRVPNENAAARQPPLVGPADVRYPDGDQQRAGLPSRPLLQLIGRQQRGGRRARACLCRQASQAGAGGSRFLRVQPDELVYLGAYGAQEQGVAALQDQVATAAAAVSSGLEVG